jgi:anhydro-N-acetylmuramic acid kinase
MPQNNLYIGVMSGTSSDGIDLSLCRIENDNFSLIDGISKNYTNKLRDKIINLNSPSVNDLEQSILVGNEVSNLTSKLILNLIKRNNLEAHNVIGIGFHGPTVRHNPKSSFSIQIGNASLIAKHTKIKVVHNFRNSDVADCGQGAPLIPIFHNYLMKINKISSAIFLNIGGFSNISIINKSNMLGFDCGPGNIFLDSWIKKVKNKNFDNNGSWSKKGQIEYELLAQFLKDPFFNKKGAKSTSRDYFNESWLKSFKLSKYKPENVQRTFLELTIQAIEKHLKEFKNINHAYIFGGGFYNTYLMDQLKERTQINFKSSNDFNLDPKYVESSAFAWIASKSINNEYLDLRSVTGSKNKNIYGVISQPPTQSDS